MNKKNELNPEKIRLEENASHNVFWKKWGPYLSERQWGTVREDYSESGSAWEYLTHDQARSKAYHWGEDGIAGISDIDQKLCFSIALWNGKDPILKERLFGLNGNEGNHGEDVKELYYYLDNTPTHSYMKYLYKYPQSEFPYNQLVETNRYLPKNMTEFEILDSGVFGENKYFDVFVEYIKESPDDIIIRIRICNRGSEKAWLTVLPTLWFRNTWTFNVAEQKPNIRLIQEHETLILEATHFKLGAYYLFCDNTDRVLFTENETNFERLYNIKNTNPNVKDAFHDVIVNGKEDIIKGRNNGTKAAPVYSFYFEPEESKTITMRLTSNITIKNPFQNIDEIINKRIDEADDFYKEFIPKNASIDEILAQRQAFAGLFWSKQYYNYEIETWISGDKGQPPPPAERKHGRNSGWAHLFNRDVISMPDKWEYPWYATWDLAFHCIPLAMTDPDFAKKQLLLFLREWYMHPNGQLPAYEWAFDDVNPPVHAWACHRVYQIEKESTGKGDISFLKRAFHKLLLSFTWWVNRKDGDGHNVFQGGFLGLDNIGVFDRSKPLPVGGHLDQADGTSWMAMFSLNMMSIALELASEDIEYEDMASKFFEHFVYITEAFNNFGKEYKTELWNEEDGFFYDAIHFDNGQTLSIRIRSLVGLIPLFAVAVFDSSILERFPGFAKRLKWFRNSRINLEKQLIIEKLDGEGKILFSLIKKDRLIPILERMLDKNEFLAPGGIRSLSKYHEKNPFTIHLNSENYSIEYQPAESKSSLFGGNSNWRGPVWIPTNYLIIESIMTYSKYFKESIKIQFPTGSDKYYTLSEIASKIAQRIIGIFLENTDGKRPIHGDNEIYWESPYFKKLLLFYEYFHGDTCRGLGASHQTGWTALVAKLIADFGGQK